MPFDSIKTIIIGLTLVLLLYMSFLYKSRDGKTLRFLISSTLVTSLLLSIITLNLHHILRDELNIPNTVTYVLTAAPFIYHLYRFRTIILNTQYFLLTLSILLLGLALLLDLFTDGKIITFSSSDFIEEILRVLGALFWLLYYFFYCFRLNRN